MTEREMLTVRTFIEYWVSEINEDEDIIDYVFQEGGRGSRVTALRYFDDHQRLYPAAVLLRIERVTRTGSNAEGLLDQKYETLGERPL
jgi:hypothetical protein